MREDIRILLGILDLIAFAAIIGLGVFVGISEEFYGSTWWWWDLPFIIASLLTLFGGIFALKRESMGWAVTGFFVAVGLVLYLLVLGWASSWTMT